MQRVFNLHHLVDPRSLRGNAPGDLTLGLAALLLVCVFAMGGSSRPDVESLQIVRPLSIIVLGLALMTLRPAHIRDHTGLLVLSFAYVALAVLQIVPLPVGATGGLAEHRLLASIDSMTGIGPIVRPLAMSQDATLNAVWALVVPLSMLLLGIQLAAAQHNKLLIVVLAGGGVSALIALLQTMGDPEGALYFYETTNFGSAVGLFANRNHQAAMLACLIPLIFAAVSRPNSNQEMRDFIAKKSLHLRVMAVGAAAFLVPLILITGSRSGLLLGVFAFGSLPFIVSRAPMPVKPKRFLSSRALKVGLAVAVIAALIFIGIWLQRALAIDRLLNRDALTDMRFRVLPVIYDMTWALQPLGAGLGSFNEVFKVHEPASLLNAQYMNQVHNDWLDLALTGGLPFGFVVAAGACWLAVRATPILLSKNVEQVNVLRRAGLAVVIILALASLSDYPLRTPALACLFTLALVWVAMPLSVSDPTADCLS